MPNDNPKLEFARSNPPSLSRDGCSNTDGDKAEARPSQHSDYWLDAGFSVFEVEQTQFRVPNYQFIRQSSVFAEMYTLPPPPAEQESAIKLPGVSALDFSRLLKVLYPLHGNVELSSDEWVSVLRLSTMWYMLELRAQAVSRVFALSPTQKIGLGRELKVSEWFIDGCLDFIVRDKAFTEEEVAAIGSFLCIHLFRIREERWRANKGFKDWRAIVHDKLKDEVKEIAQDESGYQIEPKRVEKEENSPKPFTSLFGSHVYK